MLANKIEILKELIKLTKDSKIKSFHADNIVYDFQNLEDVDFYKNKQIQISNKFIPILCKTFELEFIIENLELEVNELTLITNDLKYISIDCTAHAFRRFIKRFIYIYLDEQNKVEFNVELKKILNNNFNYVLNLYLSKSLYKINTDYNIIEVLKKLLKMSRPFNPEKHTGSHKDQWNFRLRKSEHRNTQMYITHPFLFIVEDSKIRTIELYSPSLSYSKANKMTSIDKMFRRYLNKKLGLINDNN